MKRIVWITVYLALSTSLWAGLNEDLFEAVKKGDQKKVAALIKKGVDVNVKGKYGSTPLHFAAKRGRIKVMKLLMQNGANVNFKNYRSKTPLDLAKADKMKKLIRQAGGKSGKDIK